jgi:hypothetical protein
MGPVDCIVTPPVGKDPALVPANQWSKFPPPAPENIPDDYPDLYVLDPKLVWSCYFLPMLYLLILNQYSSQSQHCPF